MRAFQNALPRPSEAFFFNSHPRRRVNPNHFCTVIFRPAILLGRVLARDSSAREIRAARGGYSRKLLKRPSLRLELVGGLHWPVR
jgi:hypothetical protein